MVRQMMLPSNKDTLRSIMHDALMNSYKFWNDELTGSSAIRRGADKPFNEVLNICLTSMSTWSCSFRPSSNHLDREHWEFGASSFGDPSYYIWILVRPDRAEEIFEKHNIKEKVASDEGNNYI